MVLFCLLIPVHAFALPLYATLAKLGQNPVAQHDSCGSCPLTVELGKIVLAEFGYGEVIRPCVPSRLIGSTSPTRAAWSHSF